MQAFALGSIHPTALIGKNVELGKNVTIGAHAIIHDNVVLGDNTVVGPHCILGEPHADFYHDLQYVNPVLRIGDDALIRSGTIIYADTTVGEHFECGHRVTIREMAQIGDHCRIGTLSDIQGHCKIGRYVRMHSNVHIGQKSRIGDFVWIFPFTVLTNDPTPPSNDLVGVTIDDYAVITTMAVIMPGVHIGEDALIGAHALVKADVAPRAVVVGNPAKEVTTVDKIRSRVTGEVRYPWREHFDRGMPWGEIGYATWRQMHHSQHQE